MGIFDSIGRSVGDIVSGYQSAVAKADLVQPMHPWLSSQAEVEQWNTPNLETTKNQQELYQRLSWVQIAVGHVARQAAGTPMGVKMLEDEKRVDIINHPFEELLRQPNPAQSRFELLESMNSYWKITGNSYTFLNRARKDDPPVEMWQIPSHRIRPVPDKKLYIHGYLYTSSDGKEIPLETWEIMHWKTWNSLSPYIGLSPIAALAMVAIGDMAMQKWNTNYFAKDNAKIPGILTFADAINNKDWAEIQDDFQAQYGGTKRKLLMLRNTGQKGINWVATSMSQKDMEFLSARRFNKEEIYAMFAPGLASWLDVNSTEANSKTGKDAFMELSVWPAHQALGEKITNDILPAYGDELVAEFEDVRVQDRELDLKERQSYERTHTVDETREKFYGDDPIGDERGTMFPKEVSGTATTEAPIEVPDAKAHEREQFRRFAKARKGKREKINKFKFKYLDLDEQEMLKGEFGVDDNLVLAELTKAIDVLRETV